MIYIRFIWLATCIANAIVGNDLHGIMGWAVAALAVSIIIINDYIKDKP